MDKHYKRPFKAVLHRRSGKSTTVVFTRFYSKVASALSRGLTLALLEGQPGDVLEVSSSNFGYLIATLKLKVGSTNLTNVGIEFHVANPD